METYSFETGFYIDSVGSVLTAAHKVDTATPIVVTARSGASRDYRVNLRLNHLEASVLVPRGGPISGSTPVQMGSSYSLENPSMLLDSLRQLSLKIR